jgi:hypothetical protein
MFELTIVSFWPDFHDLPGRLSEMKSMNEPRRVSVTMLASAIVS